MKVIFLSLVFAVFSTYAMDKAGQLLPEREQSIGLSYSFDQLPKEIKTEIGSYIFQDKTSQQVFMQNKFTDNANWFAQINAYLNSDSLAAQYLATKQVTADDLFKMPQNISDKKQRLGTLEKVTDAAFVAEKIKNKNFTITEEQEKAIKTIPFSLRTKMFTLNQIVNVKLSQATQNRNTGKYIFQNFIRNISIGGVTGCIVAVGCGTGNVPLLTVLGMAAGAGTLPSVLVEANLQRSIPQYKRTTLL